VIVSDIAVLVLKMDIKVKLFSLLLDMIGVWPVSVKLLGHLSSLVLFQEHVTEEK